ncbi:MAG: hypothetical protein H7Z20_02145 [Bdellovibrio sp.]|nr:hypothetical protein [Methylotenera sp.]
MFDFLQKLLSPKTPNAARAWATIQNKAGNQASSGYWLYAAPVHLVLQRDSFSLAEPAPLPLDAEEVAALTAVLNKHFEVDKMQFFWHDNVWFLRLESNPNINTSAPEAAINQDVNAFLPTGEGAAQWAKFSNEMQMLLFEHPVNLAREASNRQAINSIWCYGGGQMELVE